MSLVKTGRAFHLAAALAVASLFCVLGHADAAPPDDSGVVRATLANGLRVVIVRNTLAPVVATSVNYLAGSDEAPDGFPGTAHAQEHMMFRGSPGLTADQLAVIGAEMGGNFNADTREGLTQYLYTVPADDLDVALHIEALRMQGVDDTQAGWDKERGAIEQEVAQDYSSPTYVLYAKLRQALFAGTPYAHDALGSRPSFDKTSAAMLRQFHDAWYAPNNAILVVVGDLDPAGTLVKIKQLFGPIAAKKLPQRPKMALTPVTPGTVLTTPTDQPYGLHLLAMRMPGLDSPDFPALEVLADVLDSHRYELYALVPQGAALDANFALQALPHGSIAYAEVAYVANADPKAIEAKVRAILANVAKNGVPPELVEAAKMQEKRQAEFQKNSIADLASVWSDALALYGLRSPDEDLRRIEKVTAADVNRVARAYLNVDQAVSAIATPQGSGKPTAASGGFGGKENIALAPLKPTDLPAWAQAALTRLAVPPSTLHPTVSVLPNGLTLIVQPEDVSDTVSIYGHIRHRAETEEPPGQDGVSLVLDQMFPYGTEHMDRLAFQQALDNIGAQEQAGTDFSLGVLAQNFDSGAALLADNELHPLINDTEMTIAQGQIAQLVNSRNQSPGYLWQRALRSGLFPATDPSLREATLKTVGSLTLDDVRTFHRATYRPDLTSIVVIGKVTPGQARAVIEKYFGGWKAEGPKPNVDLSAVPDNKPAVVSVPDASRVQDQVLLAQSMAMTRRDPDYYALNLGNAVLGGGFYATRLSIDLRKNTGIVYSVASQMQSGRTRTAYLVDYACDPGNVGRAAAIVAKDIRDMQTTPVGEYELDRAKAILLRQMPLAESSVEQIANGLNGRADLGLPLDEPTVAAERYVALTPGQVQAAFRKWMRPDDLVRADLGPVTQ